MKILLPLLSLLISACSAQDVVTGAQISADLAVAQSSYAETRASVERRLASLSDEKATELRALLVDADSLKASVEAIWTDKLVPTAADVTVLYQAGEALYVRGITLVTPLMSSMPLADQIRVRRFAETMKSLGEHYQAWQASPTAQTQSALLSRGLELAKMAVQIGMVVL